MGILEYRNEVVFGVEVIMGRVLVVILVVRFIFVFEGVGEVGVVVSDIMFVRERRFVGRRGVCFGGVGFFFFFSFGSGCFGSFRGCNGGDVGNGGRSFFSNIDNGGGSFVGNDDFGEGGGSSFRNWSDVFNFDVGGSSWVGSRYFGRLFDSGGNVDLFGFDDDIMGFEFSNVFFSIEGMFFYGVEVVVGVEVRDLLG